MSIFRVACTPIENTIFQGKSLEDVDVSLFKYGEPIEEREFGSPDGHGSMFLSQSWRRECERLNEEYPQFHHWIDTEQPDENGVYYRGLPGEHK